MPSRGMGAVRPAVIRKVKKRDGNEPVTVYKKGGQVKFSKGGDTSAKENPAVAAARKAEESLRNYNDELMFMERKKIPSPETQQAQKKKLYQQMIDAAPLGYKPSFKPGENYGLETPKEWKDVEQLRKNGGPVWDRPRPKDLGNPKKLSSAKKASAKAMAKAAGRPYPNLVDNMRAARRK